MLAVFGINNDGAEHGRQAADPVAGRPLARAVYWTFADARRRIDDPMLVGCATAASLFPFVGTIVYMIVRPPEYLDDVRLRELEMQAAEARLRELGLLAVPALRLRGRGGLPALPELHAQAQGRCTHCAKPLDPAWRICPYCEAEIPGATPSARAAGAGRRRPASTAVSEPRLRTVADVAARHRADLQRATWLWKGH